MKVFHSFTQAAEHCLKLVETVALAEHEALEHIAKVIEKQAKAEIGHYQKQEGQFAAWAELADSTKQDRERQGYTENDPGLRSGEMRESIHHKVGLHEALIGSDDDNLVWFELGTSKQPPRSVLGLAGLKKGEEAAEIAGANVAMALIGRRVFNNAMLTEEE
jgi:hypothetical protein